MLEIYSSDISVESSSAIPFNNSSVSKGITAIQIAPATIQLNKKGVYMIDCSASISPAATGTVSIDLAKDGIVQAGARSIATAATSNITPLSFTTLVQVSEDNKPCCYADNPTTIQFLNTGVAGTYSIVRAIVTKVC